METNYRAAGNSSKWKNTVTTENRDGTEKWKHLALLRLMHLCFIDSFHFLHFKGRNESLQSTLEDEFSEDSLQGNQREAVVFSS